MRRQGLQVGLQGAGFMAGSVAGPVARSVAPAQGRGPSGTGAAVLLLAVLGVAGCQQNGQMDWDLRRNGFSTADAARGATAARPQPDRRGIITYPGYRVAVAQRGETVRQMATRLGVNAAELSRQNALDADSSLRGGELLVLPGGSNMPPIGAAAGAGGAGSGAISVAALAPVAPQGPAGAPQGSEPTRHTVQRGETAFSIARLYNVPARSLAEWNGLAADLSVREGQVLIIPVPQPISTAAATPPPAPVPVASAPVVPPPGAPMPIPTPGSTPPVTSTGTSAPTLSAPTLSAPTLTAPVPPAATARPVTSSPGQGTPTPTPPSASQPLPSSTPAPTGQGAPAPAPVANMGAQRTTTPRLAMPVQGRVIRAYQRGRNDGIGIGAPAGTEVRAAAAGTVAAITRDTDQVPILVVRHENNLLTVYANIDNIRVERGARVSAGQVLATVRRGDPSFLHFEVREGFDSVDPMPFLQ